MDGRLTPEVTSSPHRPEATIQLLADSPHLIAAVAEMRWKAWGDPSPPGENGLAGWIEITGAEAGKDQLPITWVAVDEHGAAVGAAALQSESDLRARPELRPSVVGVVVDCRHRRSGFGRLLLGAVEAWAGTNGVERLWVVTGGQAEAFYRRCGWHLVEEPVTTPTGVHVAGDVCVLTKST
ncbi:MAG TPA: GNAT family N-acetyltransferase [Actinomycetota bacterium]|nr:GNAT family N-acetyltransferase [Actinomycetota bacterium]